MAGVGPSAREKVDVFHFFFALAVTTWEDVVDTCCLWCEIV